MNATTNIHHDRERATDTAKRIFAAHGRTFDPTRTDMRQLTEAVQLHDPTIPVFRFAESWPVMYLSRIHDEVEATHIERVKREDAMRRRSVTATGEKPRAPLPDGYRLMGVDDAVSIAKAKAQHERTTWRTANPQAAAEEDRREAEERIVGAARRRWAVETNELTRRCLVAAHESPRHRDVLLALARAHASGEPPANVVELFALLDGAGK